MHKPSIAGERIRFIDVGAGANAVRARRMAERQLAKKRPGKTVALDLNGFNKINASSNLLLVQKNATEYLNSLPAGSVGIVNFDLSLMSARIERMVLREVPNMPKTEQHVTITPEFCSALKHVLPWNGRVFVNTSISIYRELVQELQKHGFDVKAYPMGKAWDKIQSRAYSMDEISRLIGERDFVAQSVQLVVRKKRE